MRLGEFVRENLEAGQLRALLRRVDRPLGKGPSFLRIEPDPAKCVRDHIAIDRLRGMTRPPADDVIPQPALGENVPKRFALARSARVRPSAPVHRIRLDESVDAMLIRKLTRRDRIPEHGGENRLEGCEVPHDPAVYEGIEGRHKTLLEQRIDMFPVSRVPPDEQNFSFTSLLNHGMKTSRKISALHNQVRETIGETLCPLE